MGSEMCIRDREELISYEFSCLLELGFQPKIHRYVENYPTLTGLPELLSKDLLENDEYLIEIRSQKARIP